MNSIYIYRSTLSTELSAEKGRAKLDDLIEQYETNIDNAISLRSEIIEAVDNEKDEDFNLQVMGSSMRLLINSRMLSMGNRSWTMLLRYEIRS